MLIFVQAIIGRGIGLRLTSLEHGTQEGEVLFAFSDAEMFRVVNERGALKNDTVHKSVSGKEKEISL